MRTLTLDTPTDDPVIRFERFVAAPPELVFRAMTEVEHLPHWWGPHAGYTLAKMGMSLVTLGLAAEFGDRGVAVNALWPRTVIATDAINMIPGVELGRCRTAEILADAAHAILCTPARELNGRFLIDEPVLRLHGVSDFDRYAIDPSQALLPDLFLDPDAFDAAGRATA